MQTFGWREGSPGRGILSGRSSIFWGCVSAGGPISLSGGAGDSETHICMGYSVYALAIGAILEATIANHPQQDELHG